MIRYRSQKELSFDEFEMPFEKALGPDNRWIKMLDCIPWDDLAQPYYCGFSSGQGSPAKDARLVIGALIIKHKVCVSDEETVRQIQEHPYPQFFGGLSGCRPRRPFAASLFVDIRWRLCGDVFE